MRQAINAHCKNRIYDAQQPGTWVAQTEACTIVRCSPHPFRPVTTATRKLTAKPMDADKKAALGAVLRASRERAKDLLAKTPDISIVVQS